MKAERMQADDLILGLVSISDRASSGTYTDEGLPGLKAWFERALVSPWQAHERLIPDERPIIERTLIEQLLHAIEIEPRQHDSLRSLRDQAATEIPVVNDVKDLVFNPLGGGTRSQ